jgi:uncharacterized phage protein (TIGR02218 family)
MSYDTIERSAHGASPVELYEFRRGVRAWYYATGGSDVEFSGQAYKSVLISRNAIEQNNELSRAALMVSLPRDVDVAADYIPTPPSEVTTLRVWRQHRGDDETVVIWVGRALNADWKSNATVTLNCEPVFSSMRRQGLRRMYQRNCPHLLYGAACGVNDVAYRVLGVVDAIAGSVVTVPEAALYADGTFDGGMAAWSDGSTIEKRMVLSHVGQSITLLGYPRGLSGAASMQLFPGCGHHLNDCVAYGNTDNFGGMPYWPNVNPFGGATIF